MVEHLQNHGAGERFHMGGGAAGPHALVSQRIGDCGQGAWIGKQQRRVQRRAPVHDRLQPCERQMDIDMRQIARTPGTASDMNARRNVAAGTMLRPWPAALAYKDAGILQENHKARMSRHVVSTRLGMGAHAPIVDRHGVESQAANLVDGLEALDVSLHSGVEGHRNTPLTKLLTFMINFNPSDGPVCQVGARGILPADADFASAPAPRKMRGMQWARRAPVWKSAPAAP